MVTPEEYQGAARAAAAEKFSREMLGVFRMRLFADVGEKEWFEHRGTMLQAVMEPARFLRERGAALPGSRYREILMEILAGIEQHGNLSKIRRKAIYVLHCVQMHMKRHGGNYYEEGKTPRGVSLMVGGALKALTPQGQAHGLTAALGAAAAVIRGPGGRRKPRGGGIQGELF